MSPDMYDMRKQTPHNDSIKSQLAVYTQFSGSVVIKFQQQITREIIFSKKKQIYRFQLCSRIVLDNDPDCIESSSLLKVKSVHLIHTKELLRCYSTPRVQKKKKKLFCVCVSRSLDDVGLRHGFSLCDKQGTSLAIKSLCSTYTQRERDKRDQCPSAVISRKSDQYYIEHQSISCYFVFKCLIPTERVHSPSKCLGDSDIITLSGNRGKVVSSFLRMFFKINLRFNQSEEMSWIVL